MNTRSKALIIVIAALWASALALGVATGVGSRALAQAPQQATQVPVPTPPAGAGGATLTTSAPAAVSTTPGATFAATTSPVTQNTVSTTGPVSSETTISIGTLAGQVLTWIMAAFAVPVGGFLTRWLILLGKNAGVQFSAQMRAQLQDIVVNGLNSAAATEATNLQGKGQVEIKNRIATGAVAYVQAHGADTIKALGLDPQSGEAVAAIQARIETAIADPTQPTPAVLDKPA